MYNLHYIAGLRQLGYDIHYLEIMAWDDECYDLDRNVFSDDCGCGLRILRDALENNPAAASAWTLIDRAGVYHGAPRRDLVDAIDRADFVLTLCDPAWHDDLERCPRRAFLDGDPMFTQMRMLEAGSQTATAVAHYPTLFTYWTRQGAADTTVPAAGRDWISTTAVVATDMWQPAPPRPHSAITTVMNWNGFDDVTHNGVTYGKKDRSFWPLIGLPKRTHHTALIAVGGTPPEERLIANGWTLINPLDVTSTIDGYREFIDGSYADFGIAKDAYVRSRSGWFSDRSLCYLASGRPVLHQDTGFTDWLPTRDGLIAFANVDEVVEGLRAFDRDYDRHSRAAREIASEHFEARTVIARMLDDAGWR